MWDQLGWSGREELRSRFAWWPIQGCQCLEMANDSVGVRIQDTNRFGITNHAEALVKKSTIKMPNIIKRRLNANRLTLQALAQ